MKYRQHKRIRFPHSKNLQGFHVEETEKIFEKMNKETLKVL